MNNPALLFRLALADLWHDRKLSFCMIIALVAVITPLLLLFGLKHGVVSHLQNELLQNPVNLEIRMKGNRSYDEAWISSVREQRETGFVIGHTRSLSAVVTLRKITPNTDSTVRPRFLESVEVLPTGPGDPLTQGLPALKEARQIYVSFKVARELQLSVGDTLRLELKRQSTTRPNRDTLHVEIAGLVPEESLPRTTILVTLPLLLAIEYYLDGSADTLEEALQSNAEPRFARARIYARNIDSVQALEIWLNTQNIETTSRLNEILEVRQINDLLNLIIGVIAATGITGCLMSLTGTFIANLDRKRKDMALLRLLGFRNASVGLYVVAQAWLLTSAAFLAGLLVYGVVSHLLDQALHATKATSEFASSLTTTHMATAALITWGVASIASVWGAMRAIHIQPAESLREL